MNEYKMYNKNKYKNTAIYIFSSGIFTITCNSNITPTQKYKSCFFGCMLNMPVTTEPRSIPQFLPSKQKKILKKNYKNLFQSIWKTFLNIRNISTVKIIYCTLELGIKIQNRTEKKYH
jgi:hypothetical protein